MSSKISENDRLSFKKDYIKLLSGVKRKGIKELIKFLEDSDFFTAPASSSKHSNFKGGLLIHSLAVYYLLRDRVHYFSKRTDPKIIYSEDTVKLVALLHDVCKINLYVEREYSLVGYNLRNKFPIGHGEKSVIMLLKYIDLTEEEMLAIRWHMGNLFDNNSKDLARAIKQCPLVVLLQHADIESSTFLEF